MSYIPEPVTRTDKYLAYIAGNMDVALPDHPITRKEHYLAAWAKKSGFEDADVTGKPPLTLENAIGEPLKGLRIYGKSKQVTTTGAQLLEKNIVVHPPNGGVKSIVLFEGELSGTHTVSCVLEGDVKKPEAAALEIIVDGVHKYCIANNHTVATGMITKITCFGQNTYCDFTGTLNIMLNAGSAPFPWEPYTSGLPSPSPDYPQEIESAGSYGKIGIEVRGKNLMDFTKVPDVSDLYQGWKIPKKDYESATVTLFDNDVTVDISEFFFGFTKEGVNATNGYKWMVNNGRIEKREFNSKFGYLSIFPKDFMKTFLQRFKILVEIGTISTVYEPYHEPQSMDIATPNGLPGIRVASDGNYTDADGQQWVCDEIDFGRGVYVQRIKVSKSLNNLIWYTWGVNKSTNGITGFFTYNIDTPKIGESVSNIALYNEDIHGGKKVGICASTIKSTSQTPYMILCVHNDTISDISSDNAAIRSFKEMLAKTDAYMMYVLATPIETPLTDEQIAAYKQLHTYKGTTIIDNDAGAYMSVRYEKMK